MLQTLRKHSGNWFFKTLLGFIAVSFVMWGVADMIMGYNNMRPVAKVDGDAISQEDFARQYDREMSLIQHRSMGKAKLDDEKKATLQQKILDRLIDQAITRHAVSKLNLAVTDAYIRQFIQADPTFRNESGVFDKGLLNQILASNHMTENMFVQSVRSNLMTNQVLGTISAGSNLPKFYAGALFEGQEQQKRFAVVHIPLSQMVVTEKAKPSDLDQLYKSNPDLFTRPESREVSLLIAHADHVKAQIAISDSQLQDEYQARLAEFTLPEKRHLQLIKSKSAQSLDNVTGAFNVGRPMAAIARSVQGVYEDLPDATKDQLPPNAADVVFSLSQGSVSAPIDLGGVWGVYAVISISPARIQPFEEVKADLTNTLKTQQLNEVMHELRNKIEDSIAGGAQIAEVAQELKLETKTFAHVTKAGHDLSGRPVFPENLSKIVLEQMVDLAENTDSPVVDLADGGLLMVHVGKIHPPFLPNFTEIQGEIEAAWADTQRQKAAADIAKELSAQLTPDALSGMVKKYNLVLENTPPVSRSSLSQDVKIAQLLPQELWRQAFSLPPHKAMSGPGKTGFNVVMLTDILPIDTIKLSDKMNKFNLALNELVRRDIGRAYVNGIKATLMQQGKIDINEGLLTKIRQR